MNGEKVVADEENATRRRKERRERRDPRHNHVLHAPCLEPLSDAVTRGTRASLFLHFPTRRVRFSVNNVFLSVLPPSPSLSLSLSRSKLRSTATRGCLKIKNLRVRLLPILYDIYVIFVFKWKHGSIFLSCSIRCSLVGVHST